MSSPDPDPGLLEQFLGSKWARLASQPSQGPCRPPRRPPGAWLQIWAQNDEITDVLGVKHVFPEDEDNSCQEQQAVEGDGGLPSGERQMDPRAR